MSTTRADEISCLADSAVSLSDRAARINPSVIGLYGVPGCGKTYLLKNLKNVLGEETFAFYESSEVIDDIVPGGFQRFVTLSNADKSYWSMCAIKKIRNESITSGKTAIVTGYFSFWPEGYEKSVLSTEGDMITYTHILYLDVRPETIVQQRLDDKERSRPNVSTEHLEKWEKFEKAELRDLCQLHDILFLSLSSGLMEINTIKHFILDFQRHDEYFNLSSAKLRLDNIMVDITANSQRRIESMLVLDADRILTEDDTGRLFWEDTETGTSPLEAIFNGPLGDSYTFHHQAVLLYEESANFEDRCRSLAAKMKIHPEFICLLQLVKTQPHVGAMIITCGVRRIWEEVLKREGLFDKVKVIGGSRINDGFVVTSRVKEVLVTCLREHYDTYVWAFGNSPLDIKMLKKANQAIVVAGNDRQRTRTMDDALIRAFDYEGFKARQVILPSTASLHLNIKRFPVIDLTQREFVAHLLARGSPRPGIKVVEATNESAVKLLMTPMHDANNSGPTLCEAHRRTGSYLATELVSSIIGCETYSMQHAQGYRTNGSRLFHEDKTTIVALMRDGDPMARGVWEVFPKAMYVHAKYPDDVKKYHLEGQVNVLLVDSAIDSGRVIAEFVQRIRNLHATIRIVVVASVVCAESISGRYLSQALAGSYDMLSIAMLHLSETGYSCFGDINTGDILFNT